MTKDSGKHDILPADGALRHRARMPVTMPRPSDRQVRRQAPAAAPSALQTGQDERGLMHGASRLHPSAVRPDDPRSRQDSWRRCSVFRLGWRSSCKRRARCLEPRRAHARERILRQDKGTAPSRGMICPKLLSAHRFWVSCFSAMPLEMAPNWHHVPLTDWFRLGFTWGPTTSNQSCHKVPPH